LKRSVNDSRLIPVAVATTEFFPDTEPFGLQPCTLVNVPEIAVKGALVTVGQEAYDKRFLAIGRELT
jgi:hypothetical protein